MSVVATPPAEVGTVIAARMLGVDRSTVNRWIIMGLLPGHRVTPGGHRRIPVTSVEALAARMAGEQS